MPAPLIAVPTAHVEQGAIRNWRPGAFAVAETYIAAIRRAGGRPVLIPAPDPAPAGEVLACFDGVLLTGGGDLHPSHYGAEPHPTTADVQPDRDGLELDLVRACARLGLPLLGICRGMQAVNVAFGGTLHQHLPERDGIGDHGDPDLGTAVTHSIRIQPGSRLAQVSGATRVSVVARHHQGVDRLGDGLVASAWTEDGLVEAVERPGGAMLAVQWHPEVTAAEDPSQQALFDSLVAEASKHTLGRVA